MEFKIFKEILLAAKDIEEVVSGLETALGIQFGESKLLDTETQLLNILADKYEFDTDEDSIIYHYAFENKWGDKPETYYIQGEKYVVDSPESLYKYLTERSNYEYVKDIAYV